MDIGYPIAAKGTSAMSDKTNEVGHFWMDDLETSASVIETLPVFCVAVDAKGNTLRINQAMLDALGYTRDEVIGKPYMRIFVPEADRAALARVFGQLMEKPMTTLSENRVCAKDGGSLQVEWHGRSIFRKEKEFAYFFGIGIDVSRRRRAEEALDRSEQKLSLHVQQTSMGIIEWSTDFRVAAWNPAAEKIFGYSEKEALGMEGLMLVPKPVRPLVGEVWRRLLEGRSTVTSVNENIRRDGQLIICDWHNTPLVDSSGNVMGVASMISDVSDQKRNEEELKRREREQKKTIEELSAPVLDVAEGILMMPVMGRVDEERASRMTEALLRAIVQSAAKFMIVDLTGLNAQDASIAEHLGRIMQSARLLGARCLVSGLSPDTALMLMEHKALALGDVPAFGTLRAALSFALWAIRQGRA